jgi:hypothetical protein
MEIKRHEHGLDDDDIERYRLENLHLYFDYLNFSYPSARKIAFWSYVVDFGLLAIPSLEVFSRVMLLMLKIVAGFFS